MNSRLNWLRAGVLGAHDGITSTAALVVGVAAASPTHPAVLTAGVVGLLAGSLSMAAGEYVSVSSQRDSQKAARETERRQLDRFPEAELRELTDLLEQRGVSRELAREAADQVALRDTLRSHAWAGRGVGPDGLAHPGHAAFASFVAFTCGALPPLAAVLLPPPSLRVPMALAAALCTLALCGWISAHLGQAPRRRAVLRNMAGGLLALAVMYGVGHHGWLSHSAL
ncbi:VIT family protein [Streptomyces sp. ISL-44]|uniref:VIT1/CCC1 transporter family protein n=1 Tax=Streptomyces sp. ISL-44 TaxID=2819184 RepID=UPI001BE59C54|nr:VIT family protein [Streptomyces sp. ISL-44]MBT2542688.1 VIT family protein [Streptomyces sp. ISL-44]